MRLNIWATWAACISLAAPGCAEYTTVSVSATCGDSIVSNHSLDVGRRDQAAVRVQIDSIAPGDLSGRLRVTVFPDDKPALLAVDQAGTLLPGTSVAEYWFPIAELSAHSRVRVELSPFGASEPSYVHEQDVKFACVSACPAHNVVVRNPPGSSCANIAMAGAEWTGQSLATTEQTTYCSYAWNPLAEPQSTAPLPPPDLTGLGGLDWQIDCAVVTTEQARTPPGQPKVAPVAAISPRELAEATEKRLGIDDMDALGWPATSARSVLLAVVDTAKHPFTDGRSVAKAPRDNNVHGRAVGLLAHRVACGNGRNCPVKVHNELAFPIIHPNYRTDTDDGGYLATRGQIAAALHRVIERWQTQNTRGTPMPLVLNLSFGWHAKHDCSTPGCGEPLHNDLPSTVLVPDVAGVERSPRDGDSFSYGSEAVLVEIARARCLGALVFAAAGNRVGRNDQGAVLPAAWNRLDAGALDCKKILGSAPAAATVAPSGALVSATAALDFDGEPSPLTRFGSLPRLVAHGASVALLDADDPRSGDPDWTGVVGPFSGTSFATAVVSGAAARLWAELPSHSLALAPSAADVEAALFNHGAPVAKMGPELCVGSPYCPAVAKVSEISACTAFQAIGLASRCSADRNAVPNGLPFSPPSSAGTAGIECVAPGAPLEPAGVPTPPRCAPDLEPRIDAYEAPWVLPQPSGVYCVTCSQRLRDILMPGKTVGTRYAVEFASAEMWDTVRASSRIGAARLRVGTQYQAAISPLLFQDPRRLTGTVDWGLYASNPLATPATLQVDLATTASNVVGQAETAILRLP